MLPTPDLNIFLNGNYFPVTCEQSLSSLFSSVCRAKVRALEEWELRGCWEAPRRLPPPPAFPLFPPCASACEFIPAEWISRDQNVNLLKQCCVDLGKWKPVQVFWFYPPKAKFPSPGQWVSMLLGHWPLLVCQLSSDFLSFAFPQSKWF